MPVGIKVIVPALLSVHVKDRFMSKSVIIRLPTIRPLRTMIAPKPRPGSKQYTCIRYDFEGRWFVDEFVERSQATSSMLAEGRRLVRHITCPSLHFEVALGTCHHYCSFPCRAHVDALMLGGWYTGGGGPKIGRGKLNQKLEDDE